MKTLEYLLDKTTFEVDGVKFARFSTYYDVEVEDDFGIADNLYVVNDFLHCSNDWDAPEDIMERLEATDYEVFDWAVEVDYEILDAEYKSLVEEA